MHVIYRPAQSSATGTGSGGKGKIDHEIGSVTTSRSWLVHASRAPSLLPSSSCEALKNIIALYWTNPSAIGQLCILDGSLLLSSSRKPRYGNNLPYLKIPSTNDIVSNPNQGFPQAPNTPSRRCILPHQSISRLVWAPCHHSL